MIQCVGSRNDSNPNCSRICCQTAIKNALHIKKLNPDAQDVYLCIGISGPTGFWKIIIRKPVKKGCSFSGSSLKIRRRWRRSEEGLTVTFTDHVLGENCAWTAIFWS